MTRISGANWPVAKAGRFPAGNLEGATGAVPGSGHARHGSRCRADILTRCGQGPRSLARALRRPLRLIFRVADPGTNCRLEQIRHTSDPPVDQSGFGASGIVQIVV